MHKSVCSTSFVILLCDDFLQEYEKVLKDSDDKRIISSQLHDLVRLFSSVVTVGWFVLCIVLMG